MKNFVNCYPNGNVTVLGITIGDDFQYVMKLASSYGGKTCMHEVIIPSYKINDNLYVSILYKFDNNKCVDITIKSCADRTINVWDAVNVFMSMLDSSLFVINNSSSNHDSIKYRYLNSLLDISICTQFNADDRKIIAVMHISSRYCECFGNKLNSESVMSRIFHLYKIDTHSGQNWLKYYYMVLSMIVASVFIYCCCIFLLNNKTIMDSNIRYTLQDRYVLDNETGKVYFISTSFPPKKVFDASLLK